jgi:magnesium-dependent phosphatase 1
MAEKNSQDYERLINFLLNLKSKPKCIVFDLDYTLWPFNVDSHLVPPFKESKKTEDNTIVIHDHNKKLVNLYTDVKLVIETLSSNKISSEIQLAIASRSTAPNLANQLIEMFQLSKCFQSCQIYPGSKQVHLRKIRTELKISSFNHMLFFDDNKSNLEQAESLGVTCYQLRRQSGLNMEDFFKGLQKYSLNNSITSSSSRRKC